MSSKKPDVSIYCAHDAVLPLSELKPNPRNPNKHPPEQIKLLAKIISAQGWRNPIVVSNRSRLITKGHARLAAASQLGLKSAPVDYQDYASENEELADMIADNRIAELAEADRAMLRDLAEQLDDGAFDMDLTGFDQAALEELMTAAPPESDVDAEPQIDQAEQLAAKWQVKRGQIWELGAHRLMCGDSTSGENVEQLSLRCHLMVTDPPYGVEYNAAWRNDAAAQGLIGQQKSTRAIGKVNNDDRIDWTAAWEAFAGDVAYIWHAGRHASEVQSSLNKAGFEIRCQLIWAKNNFAISRGDYHWKHEPCWYAVRKGRNGHWSGDRSQTTLWEIDKPLKSDTGHSTQKPVECMARPVRNNSSSGDEVYDPFLGSGTTLIACEQLHRKCRAMEIDPGYVAVAIQRWADATGKTPRLLESGSPAQRK